jgi:histidyl-tRNA synthetase
LHIEREGIEMKANTVRGTRDILPKEERVRDYIKNTILRFMDFLFQEEVSLENRKEDIKEKKLVDNHMKQGVCKR